MGIFKTAFATAVVAAAVFGCAKDRTVEEFNDQDALNKLAKFSAVNGTYSGLLLNEKSQAMGAIEVILKAKLDTSSNGGGSSGGSQPSSGYHALMVTELHFRDLVTQVNMRTENGYYDPETGIYQADLPVSNGKISITGNIHDGHIQGSVQGVGFASRVTTFDIRGNGGTLEDLSKMTKATPTGVPENLPVSFSGKGVFPPVKDPVCVPTKKDNCNRAQNYDLTLTSVFLVRTPADHFAAIFMPDNAKIITVSLIAQDADFAVPFNSAQWDTESGLLIGESTFTGPTTGTIIRHLLCQKFFFEKTGQPFNCTFWTDRTSIAKMTFNPPSPSTP